MLLGTSALSLLAAVSALPMPLAFGMPAPPSPPTPPESPESQLREPVGKWEKLRENLDRLGDVALVPSVLTSAALLVHFWGREKEPPSSAPDANHPGAPRMAEAELPPTTSAERVPRGQTQPGKQLAPQDGVTGGVQTERDHEAEAQLLKRLRYSEDYRKCFFGFFLQGVTAEVLELFYDGHFPPVKVDSINPVMVHCAMQAKIQLEGIALYRDATTVDIGELSQRMNARAPQDAADSAARPTNPHSLSYAEKIGLQAERFWGSVGRQRGVSNLALRPIPFGLPLQRTKGLPLAAPFRPRR